MNNKPMLNAYPDSLGGKLSDIAALLKKKKMQDTVSLLRTSLRVCSLIIVQVRKK